MPKFTTILTFLPTRTSFRLFIFYSAFLFDINTLTSTIRLLNFRSVRLFRSLNILLIFRSVKIVLEPHNKIFELSKILFVEVEALVFYFDPFLGYLFLSGTILQNYKLRIFWDATEGIMNDVRLLFFVLF